MSILRPFEVAYLWLHRFAYVQTDGRIGHGMTMVPTLLLRTNGRRTRRRRTNVLVYAVDGGTYVLVASNFGKEQSPGWFFNLCAEPKVEVQVRRTREAMVAHVVHAGESDYERLWMLVNGNNHRRYASYQAKTTRSIPIVVLQPA
jgi:deazaflavin-dependent oxidoreductase (nitroreductase family)